MILVIECISRRAEKKEKERIVNGGSGAW